MKCNLIYGVLGLLFTACWFPAAARLSGTLIKGSEHVVKGAASVSYYQTAPEDTAACYFTAERYGIRTDGSMDVSDALQQAINGLKRNKNFGVLFIPEGEYLISKTIYIPAAIRLIGYGVHRPVIKLKDHAAGFAAPVAGDKGSAAYMLWFTSSIPETGKGIPNAGAGTFYSAFSNIDLEIGAGNTAAVALRTHYAQHCFIEHVNIHIGSGKAGIFDIGNEIQDVRFYGGDYGIYTTKSSPGWPYMMLDTYFEGQRKAAIKTQEAGLTVVRMHVRNVPVVIDVDKGFWEKLYMEDCLFENVADCALRIGMSHSPETQVNLQKIQCRKVPELVRYKDREGQPERHPDLYEVRNYTAGLVMDSLCCVPHEKVFTDIKVIDHFVPALKTDIPDLPATSKWVNIKSLGAVGNGLQDETALVQAAIDRYDVIYFPAGRYKVSQTIHLRSNTVLIGLHPFATQILLADNTPAFGGFGGPVSLIVSGKGGHNIISGIGLNTGRRNTRAVALQWEAGAASMVNDVKFIGGHGQMHRPGDRGQRGLYGQGEDHLWDHQYWSLWVTRNGGGTFKNIWSASTYAAAGVYIAETVTPGRIYAMSIEHHVRNEVRFNHVSHWKIYAMQTEEESRESSDCQPLFIERSTDLQFANLYMFRVIRVKMPYPYAILTEASKDIRFLNLHNYAQTKYTSSHSLYDRNRKVFVKPWELAALYLKNTRTGDRNTVLTSHHKGNLQEVAKGFEMPEGMCSDSKGNIYFCESGKKRIYKWSAKSGLVTLLCDYPWEPLSLACDREDHLLAVFKYQPMEGYLVEGKQEVFTNPPDAAGTSFSGWGNSGFGILVYSINTDNPDHSIRPLKRVAVQSLDTIVQALYPAHRWRDFHDFAQVAVARPDSAWLAPDGVTIIPISYDLARSTSLTVAVPGEPLYVSDEYNECSYRLDVDRSAYVSDLSFFAPRGSFAIIKDKEKRVWIADGDVYGYDKDGKLQCQLPLPERATGVMIGGKNSNTLMISTYGGLYCYRLSELDSTGL